MKERPILMSSSMVRALLNGSKTQTRRAIKFSEAYADGLELTRMQDGFPDGVRPVFGYGDEPNAFSKKCPYGQPGDRLWVRERWNVFQLSRDCEVSSPLDYIPKENPNDDDDARCNYCVDFPVESLLGTDGGKGPWRPSIHMPRWASRLLLEITAVRVERVQDISEADAKAEGVNLVHTNSRGGEEWENYLDEWAFEYFAKDSYATLWDKINGEGSFLGVNPFVWVVEFKVIAQ